MYCGKYLECIIVYSSLYIGFFKKQSFISHVKNLAPLCESELVLLSRSFYSKRDAAWDDESSKYSYKSPLTVHLTLNGFDFSGW